MEARYYQNQGGVPVHPMPNDQTIPSSSHHPMTGMLISGSETSQRTNLNDDSKKNSLKQTAQNQSFAPNNNNINGSNAMRPSNLAPIGYDQDIDEVATEQQSPGMHHPSIVVREKPKKSMVSTEYQRQQNLRNGGGTQQQTLHLPVLPLQLMPQSVDSQNHGHGARGKSVNKSQTLQATKSEQEFQRTFTSQFGGSNIMVNQQMPSSLQKAEPRFRIAVPPGYIKPTRANEQLPQSTGSNWLKQPSKMATLDPKQFSKTTNRFSQIKSGGSINDEQLNVKPQPSQQSSALHKDLSKQKLRQLVKTSAVTQKKPQTHKFLSSVGGRETCYDKFSLNANLILTQEIEKDRRYKQVAVFTTMTVDLHQKPQIAHTVTSQAQQKNKPPRTPFGQEGKARLAFKDVRQSTTNLMQNNQSPQRTQVIASAPVEHNQPARKFRNDPVMLQSADQALALSRPLQQGIQLEWGKLNSGGALNQKNKELPYPEIFDRSERTIAATFGKSGDLSYFTPVQRIANFMDFSSRLKRRHLMDLIQYIKNSTLPIKTENDESDHKTASEYLEQSLFHGLMLKESNQSPSAQFFQRDGIPEIHNIEQAYMAHNVTIKGYNPSSSRQLLDLKVDKVWSPLLITQLQQSINRFLHYVDSPDAIKTEEISKYRKKWMASALNLIPDRFLNEYATSIKELFQEIFQAYLRAMKHAIVEYVVRSPNERKRLNIIILPEVVLTASELQAQAGGYSLVQYSGSHSRKCKAEFDIKLNLITNNIVQSQLCSWAHEFRNINLVDFQCLESVVQARNQQFRLLQPSNTIDMDNLFAYLESHLEKATQFLKNIWFRGALVIIKKFKLFQRKRDGYHNRRWNFRCSQLDINGDPTAKVSRSGYHPNATILQQYYFRTGIASSQLQGFEIDAVPEGVSYKNGEGDLYEHETLDDLIDIRESLAYQQFVKKIGCELNLQENGYEGLNKDYKRELKYAAGNLMHLQLREMVDRSVKVFVEYFEGFLTFKALLAKKQIFKTREVQPIVTKITTKETEMRKTQQSNFNKSQTIAQPATLKPRTSPKQKQTYMTLPKPLIEVEGPDNRQLKLPEFVHLCDYSKPVFRIELLLGCTEETIQSQTQQHIDNTLNATMNQSVLTEELTFNKTDEQILEDLEVYFDMLVTSMNDMSRPEFCKVKVISQKKYDFEKLDSNDSTTNKLIKTTKEVKRQLQFRKTVSKNMNVPQHLRGALFQPELASQIFPQTIDFDAVMYTQGFKNAHSYERFLGRVKLVEGSQEVQMKNLFTMPTQGSLTSQPATAFSRTSVQRKQNVADPSEAKYRAQKRQVVSIMKEHLAEIKRVKELYSQFESLIKNRLKKKIDDFVDEVQDTCDEIQNFKKYIEEVKFYRCLVTQLPEKIAFPMFEVSLLQVKTELRNRVEQMLFTLLSKLEWDVTRQSNDIIEVFSNFQQTLAQNLDTAQDVVEMESFKNKMVGEMSTLQVALARQKKCVHFLFSYNDLPNICQEPKEEGGRIIQGECLYAIKETLYWPGKLQSFIASSDERHQQQRTICEQKCLSTRNDCDAQIAELSVKIKKTPTFQDIKHQQRFVGIVEEINTQLTQVKEMAASIKLAEFQLFETNDENQVLMAIIKQFEPCYEMWTTINRLMQRYYAWQGTSMETLDITEVKQVLETTKQSYQDLKSKTEDKDVATNKVLTQLKTKIDELDEIYPIIEVLTSKELKETHWQKIKQITVAGDSADLKKMFLSGIECLVEKQTIPELSEIHRQAKRLFILESSLEGMESYWQPLSLKFVVVNQNTVLESAQLEEMLEVLEEHVKTAYQIFQDQEVSPILERAEAWYKKMSFLLEFLSAIDRVMTHYLYLVDQYTKISLLDKDESINFDLEAFSELDQAWHLLIARIEMDQLVLSYTSMPDMLERLSQIQVPVRPSTQQSKLAVKNQHSEIKKLESSESVVL